MRRTVDGLIDDIRTLARKRVNRVGLDESLDEVRAHLDEAIQARLEIGLSREESENEAILSFGDPEEFVQDLANEHGKYSYSLVDKGAFAAMLFSMLACAIIFPLSILPLSAFIELGIPFATAGLVAWRCWKAARPQIIPLGLTFIFGIPLYAVCYSMFALDRSQFRWETCAWTSFSIVLYLSFFAFGSWFFASLYRGDLQRNIRRAMRGTVVQPLRWRHAAFLGVLTGVSVASFLAEYALGREVDIQSLSGLALLSAAATATVIGWRTATLSISKILTLFAVAVPLAACSVSAYFFILPEGELISRTWAANFPYTLDRKAWLELRKADLHRVTDPQRADFAKHGPPYKIQATSLAPNGPYRTATTKAQAEKILSAYEKRKLAELERAAPMIEASNKQWQQLARTPYFLNTARMVPLVALRTLTLWVVVSAAQAIAALLRSVCLRRASKRIVA